MIPYDDLVAALSAWRARQGLPVSTLGGGAQAQAGSGPTPAPGSGPHGAKPGSGPNRGAPPAPPRAKQPSIPPPLAAVDDALDVDDAAMLEEHYENEGDDFAMAFNPNANADPDGEHTAIGGSPQERPTEADMGNGGGRGNRDDW